MNLIIALLLATFAHARDPMSLTNSELRASPVTVRGSLTCNAGTGFSTPDGLTDSQLRAAAVPVSGSFWQTTQPVSIASMPTTAVTGPLTDTQIRATALPVSASSLPLPTGAATESTLSTLSGKFSSLSSAPGSDTGQAAVAVRIISQLGAAGSSGLTDTQLRASAVPVSLAVAPALVASSAVIGHVIVDTAPTTAVTGPLTDTQIRATALPVSGTVTANAGTGTMAVSLATAPTTPVTGAFFQATQPVSGTFFQTTQPVSLASAPTTPVTGTFWQATQPISGTVTANAGTGTMAVSLATAPSTPVTGTFWQATQPSSIADGSSVTLGAKADAKSTATDATAVSIMSVLKQISASVQAPPSQAVTGAFFQATQPVSGTFWQSTQPVSIATMPSTPVTGTFWQATQPVSGTVTANAGTGTMAVSLATAPTTPVTGTFWQATQPVSGTVSANATLTAETTKVIGTVNIAASQHVIHDTGSTTAVTGTVTVSQVATGGNPCVNPNATLLSVTGATSGTTAVQIIALSGTTKIYICSLTVIGVSGTTPAFSLVQGTGTNCATGQTVVRTSWATTAGQLYTFHGPVAVGAAGAALCYLDTGTTPIQNYQLTYVQQ